MEGVPNCIACLVGVNRSSAAFREYEEVLFEGRGEETTVRPRRPRKHLYSIAQEVYIQCFQIENANAAKTEQITLPIIEALT
jgi:hypothetical protein